MKEIFLVRHGETDWNKLGLGQGSRNDTELNDTGIEQSEITGKYLNEYKQKDSKFDLVICSPMKRTKKTAEIICQKINYDPKKIIYMKELVERDKGLLSVGKTKEELRHDEFYNDYFRYYEQTKEGELPEDANKLLFEKYKYEPTDKMEKRLNIVINLLKTTSAIKILVISHGGTIRTLSYMLSGVKARGNLKYARNCHITYLEYDNKFKLLYPANTLHFGIYGKEYIRHFKHLYEL